MSGALAHRLAGPSGHIPYVTTALGPRGSRLASLDAGRAIAAILVVFNHNTLEIFDNTRYWPANPLPRVFDFGSAGVDYFFVLSGFIISAVYWSELGDRRAGWNFAWRRFVRIYPTYWLVLGSLLIVYAWMPNFGIGLELSPAMVASSVTLIPWRMHTYGMPATVLVPAWTLYHEVLFYLLFATMFLNRKLGIGVLAVWFCGSLLMLAVPPDGMALSSFYFSPFHLLFGFGIAAEWLFRQKLVRRPALLAIAGIAAFFFFSTYQTWGGIQSPLPFRRLPDGLGAMMAVIGLAELECSNRLHVPAVLVFLGSASYSIYLVHQPALVAIAKIVTLLPFRMELPPLVWFFVLPAGAVAVGVMLHRCLERPMLRRLRSIPVGL